MSRLARLTLQAALLVGLLFGAPLSAQVLSAQVLSAQASDVGVVATQVATADLEKGRQQGDHKQGDHKDDHGSGDHGSSGDHGHGVQKSTMDMENAEIFQNQYVHMMPHAMFGSGILTFYNLNLWQIFAIGLMAAVFFVGVLPSFSKGGRPGFLIRAFRGWCHWIRDEVVFEVMGKEEGQRFAPIFMYLFFFIAFMNLLGMLPVIGVTATASIFVTAALALITFGMILGHGISRQGLVPFFKNLIPSGLPTPLIPLMAVVELVGLLMKPGALMVRLFANMLAGHLIIYSFIGLIFLFAKMMEMSTGGSLLTALPAAGMGVFISILEAFIALLQAYIFTYLSVLFVQQAIHPDH